MSGPVDQYIVDGIAVDKSAFRADDRTSKRRNMANASAVRSADLSGQYAGVYLQNTQRPYDFYTGLDTPIDDMTDASPYIQDSAGNIFASVSSVPSPTEASLGGVFASAAVPTEYVTGLDDGGNLLRGQPSFSDLTDNVEGKDTDGLLAANSDTRVPTQKAVKTYVDALLNANDAMQFKGVIDCSSNPNYPAANAGYVYRVSVVGKIGGASGVNVEQGDQLLCIVDGSASGDQATVGARWSITQANIDGAVIGPASAVDGTPIVADGTTGKLIKSITYTAFKTLLVLVKGDVGLGNVDNTSNTTERAASATLTNKIINAANNTLSNLATSMFAANVIDTDVNLAANSDTRIASQKAVKDYVDNNGGGGGGGLTATERQNFGLMAIYLSKVLGDIRRGVNFVATGFKAATDALRGINAGSSSNVDVSNAAASGYVAPSTTVGSNQIPLMTGATTSGVTMSADAEFSGSFPAWQAANRNATDFWSSTTTPFPHWLKWDLGSSKTIANYTVQARGDSITTAASTWTFQGSATGSFAGEQVTLDTQSGHTWTNGQIKTFNIASPAGYRYYRLHVTAGTDPSGTLQIAEVTLLTASVTNNMTLVTASQTADSTVSNGRVLLEFDNTATPALNSDLTVEVTCNGGTNWSAATLSLVTANSQGGRSVAETADTACTSGTSFAARIKSLNNKSVPVYGASLTVH